MEALKQSIPGLGITASSSGFVNKRIFFEILQWIVQKLKVKSGDKYLLICDAPRSHRLSFSQLKVLQEKGLYVTYLPHNTSHILQPLDQSIYACLRQKLHTLVSQHTTNAQGVAPNQWELLFILHQAYEHAFKEKIQENAWKKAGFGKTYQETKDLQKMLVQDRASIMPKFLKQFKKHAKELDNYSEKMEEAIENDTAHLQCTDPQRQYRQDMQAEADMSFMITTINKYILCLMKTRTMMTTQYTSHECTKLTTLKSQFLTNWNIFENLNTFMKTVTHTLPNFEKLIKNEQRMTTRS